MIWSWSRTWSWTVSGRAGALLMGASLLAAFSVPAALLTDLLILVLAAYDARRAPRVTGRRRVPSSGPLRSRVDVTIELEASGPATVRVVDDLAPGLRRTEPSDPRIPAIRLEDGLELHLDDREPSRIGYGLLLARRGDHELGAVHLRVRGPWKLAWRLARIDVTDRIRVQPGIEALARTGTAGLRPDLVRGGVHRARRFGEGSEFESLRAYVPGDDPRTVDWKASARRRNLVVRNYQLERNQTVVVAIDAGRLMRERIGKVERLDHALSAALLVAERARAFGDRVGLIVFDEAVRLVAPAGKVRLGRLAEALAGVESRLVEPNYPVAFATLMRTFRRRALVMVFTDVIDGAVSHALMGALRSSTGRHLPLAIALRNPEIDAAATSEIDAPEDVYRRAAAEELLEARTLAMRNMRRGGIQTLDVRAEEAGGATLSKYLEIKKRGLL